MIHIPAQGESATWPERGPDPEDVRAWISSALPGQPEIVGPIVVHRAHAWGLTARYRITYPDPHDLVFKASFLPPEFSVAAPYRLLRRSGATGIPSCSPGPTRLTAAGCSSAPSRELLPATSRESIRSSPSPQPWPASRRASPRCRPRPRAGSSALPRRSPRFRPCSTA